MKIFLISGKAKSGKDVAADIIKEKYNNDRVIELKYADLLKYYTKLITNWNGREETKPREMLQTIGDEVKNNEGQDFFVDETIKNIEVLKHFAKVIVISDVRYINEIEKVKQKYDDVVTIRIVKPNFDNGLTEAEKNHSSETALDKYDKFDYIITNDGTIDELKRKITKIIEGE